MSTESTSTSSPERSAPAVPTLEGKGLGEYLKGVQAELKKAEWPTRPELIRMTQVVLILITVVAVYCGGLDAILSLVTDRLFNRS